MHAKTESADVLNHQRRNFGACGRDAATAEPVGSPIPDARHVAGFNSQLVAFYAANPLRLVVRNLISGEQLAQVPMTKTTLTCAEFAPNGLSMVISSADAWDRTEAFLWRRKPSEDITPLR